MQPQREMGWDCISWGSETTHSLSAKSVFSSLLWHDAWLWNVVCHAEVPEAVLYVHTSFRGSLPKPHSTTTRWGGVQLSFISRLWEIPQVFSFVQTRSLIPFNSLSWQLNRKALYNNLYTYLSVTILKGIQSVMAFSFGPNAREKPRVSQETSVFINHLEI